MKFINVLLINVLLNFVQADKMLNNSSYSGIHRVTHIHVTPNSYVCICTPLSVAKRETIHNTKQWDEVCTNQQQCSWNEEEILIRTWRHNNG